MTAHFLRATLLLWLGHALLGLPQAQASHIQGGQLTYLNVGTNQYVVTLYLYRDCSGATLPGSMSLVVQNGCSGTPAGTYPMNPVPNSISVGTQYCPAQQAQAQCTTSATLPNYETQQFRTATITIAPGQWLLSTETCCRPSTANLVGQGSFRYEAVLNNRILVNGQPVTIQNSSAQYSARDVPVPFVYLNQTTTVGFNTNDPDNTGVNPDADSLVYSLTSPLGACNAPIVYQQYTTTGGVQVISTNPLCVATLPASASLLYTPSLPISVAYNTTGSCPVLTATTPQFSFSPTAGQFTFTPNRYLATPPANGDNKYVVVGKVDEYRRLPGSNRRYLVGSVRREIFIIVISGTNGVPAAPIGTAVTPGSGTVVVSTADSLDVTIQSCSYSRVLVRFTDPDPQDFLTVVYTGAGNINTDILENGDIGTYTLVNDGTRTPVARFLFQPSPAFAGRILRIPFKVQDNACPIRGLQNRILIVRIVAEQRARAVATVNGTSSTTPAVCVGGSLTLLGTVLRPDSTRGRLQTYNYAWTGNGIVGPANTPSARVAPTMTTRYRLIVIPTVGFQTGLCADTASVLVRVAPQPAQPAITRTGNLLTSSAASGNQWYFNGLSIAGATGPTYLANTSGSYTVVSSVGTPPLACSSPVSAAVLGSRAALPGTSLGIAPNPTPDGRVLLTLTGYRQALALEVLDALGRLVMNETIATPNPAGTVRQLNLTGLPTGVYVLRVLTAGGVDVRRLVRE